RVADGRSLPIEELQIARWDGQEQRFAEIPWAPRLRSLAVGIDHAGATIRLGGDEIRTTSGGLPLEQILGFLDAPVVRRVERFASRSYDFDFELRPLEGRPRAHLVCGRGASDEDVARLVDATSPALVTRAP